MSARRWTARARGPGGRGRLVALGLLATGCGGDGGGSSGGKVTIRYAWWGAKDRSVSDQEDDEALREEVPEDQGEDGLRRIRRLLEQVQHPGRRRKPPDVFQNPSASSASTARRTVLLDLNEQVKAGNLGSEGIPERPGEVRGDRRKAARRARRRQHLRPRHTTRPPSRRRASSRKYGWTWDDFFAAAQEDRDKSDGTLYGDSDNVGVMYLYDLYLRQNGKAFFTEDKSSASPRTTSSSGGTTGQKRVKAGGWCRRQEGRTGQAQVDGQRANLSAAEFTWDNFPVRYAAEGKTQLGLAPHPDHGRQEDRPVPLLADAQRLRPHPAPQGSRPVHRLHGARPRGRQDHGLRPRRARDARPVRRVQADRRGQQGDRRVREERRRGRCPGADHPAPGRRRHLRGRVPAHRR